MSAPIAAAAMRGRLFKARAIPAASWIAPTRYPKTRGAGTHDGVVICKGTPGAISGCRNWVTAKTIAAAAMARRAKDVSQFAWRAARAHAPAAKERSLRRMTHAKPTPGCLAVLGR